MATKVCFNEIQNEIIQQLNYANIQTKITSTWFTNQYLFEHILDKTKNVNVTILINNDDVNFYIEMLNFQEFISQGVIYISVITES